MYTSLYYPLYIRSSPLYWILHDRPAEKFYPSPEEIQVHKSMLFHISAGDYVTTLITILKFFEETIYNNRTTPEMRELQLKTIKDIGNDLLYLDKHYLIVPKKENKPVHEELD